MNNSKSTSDQAQALATTMSKFKTVAAVQAWWNAKSPSQKAATIGIITGVGIGGYAFFATYKVYGISQALFVGIIYGAGTGAATTFISQAAYTKSYASATTNLGDDL